MPDYPVKVVSDDEIPVLVQAIIKAYESHIETLKNRIRELESNKTLAPVGPPIIEGPITGGIITRPRITRTSELARMLEDRTKLKDKEVKDEDVK